MVRTCLHVRFVSLLVLVLASPPPMAIADDIPRQERTDKYGDPLPPGAVGHGAATASWKCSQSRDHTGQQNPGLDR
jgi:hypothetical protein